ncbi:Golgi SNAP receptor complex member 2 [Chamberlinius hualienensis]
MEALYQDTNRLVEELHQGLVRYEKAGNDELQAHENHIQGMIDKIISNCERLDILVNKEPVHRRSNAKTKVQQLKYDCQHFQSSLRQLQQRRHARDQELRNREELLSRTFRPNDSNTSIMIDHALQHNTSLQSSHRGLDDMLGSGSNILNNLREQRLALKGVQKKILDVANMLGMSNTVMRLIERRAFQDKFILFGGMLITCVLMFLIYKYLA